MSDHRHDRPDRQSPNVLAGGAWQPRAGVLRWVPSEEPEVAPPGFSVAGLIACPTCRAQVNRMCRTKTGRHRAPHANRVMAKRCQCGSLVDPKRTYCDPCRDEAAKAVRDDYRRRTRQPRLCKCGAELAPRVHYCEPCRAEARRRTYRRRENRKPTSARRAGRTETLRGAGRCWAPLDGEDMRALCGLPVESCPEHHEARKDAA